MKPLKLSLALLIAVCVTNCSDNNTTQPNNDSNSTKRLAISYQDQLPYVTLASSNDEDYLDFDIDNNLQDKVDDPNVSWEDLDDLYNVNLLPAVKQRLAYAILVKKDLIGLVYEDPYDSKLVDSAKQYVDVLIDTEYLGYTTLYFALDAIKPGDGSFVVDRAGDIMDYAANDPFHEDIINAGVNASVDQNTYDLIEANYSILDEIDALQ